MFPKQTELRRQTSGEIGRNFNCSTEKDVKKIERVRTTCNFTLNIRQNSREADTAAIQLHSLERLEEWGAGRVKGRERKIDGE